MERDWLEVNRLTQERGQSIVAKVQTNQSNRKLTDPKLGSVDNPIMQKDRRSTKKWMTLNFIPRSQICHQEQKKRRTKKPGDQIASDQAKVPKIAHNALQQEYNESAGKRQYNTVALLGQNIAGGQEQHYVAKHK
ncbi:hypothetical protein TRIUR3_00971 [Triticum urartu]|uniref:Uncharacterized protein n=1 Tax=Triticum urartu TaxID=4572 RepID=M7ZTE1_TRIUA|nr:hypothetical protein TRIUR3_00971 [Triticum urartu]